MRSLMIVLASVLVSVLALGGAQAQTATPDSENVPSATVVTT